MKRPPMLMHVKIHGKKRRPGLWLPLFLLVPLALVLLIVLSPLILLAVIILRVSGRRKPLSPAVKAVFRVVCSIRGIRAAFDLLCSLRGLRVDVSSHDERVYISVI
ncbi:MAG: hypothetical protein E3J55_03565 [Dehalococcoidia bacterium]|nr:MAG: hypothetical protein E3J55_03565 [Dehalococcoidia bacterium]